MTLRTLQIAALAAVTAAAPIAASAQEPTKTQMTGPNVLFQSADALPGRAEIIATEMSFDGSVVKSAPYSAEGVTESVHTLADGNRIVNTTRSKVYRDSEGRTRREQSLATVGPWSSDSPHEIVLINDPVAGTNFVVQPDKKTARKMATPRVIVTDTATGPDTAKVEGGNTFVFATTAAGPSMPAALPLPPPGAPGTASFELRVADAKDAKKESLGKRTIEGVECDGTRSTVTIPAGEIGNERAIDVVSESWYSPELQTVVLSTHNDPRFGESSFRLTNISRAEPDKSLFEAPAGVTVTDDSDSPNRVVFRRRVERPKEQ